jgi:hypothetical protein
MNPLRIALDADLKARWGAEIAWSWRQLLTALGYTWIEVAPGAPCDIAYLARQPEATISPASLQARVVIVADPARWENPAALRLTQLLTGGAPGGLRFDDAAPSVAPTQIDGVVWLRRDIIFDFFWLLTGQEEAQWPQDAHGFYTLPDAWLAARALEQAPASEIVEALGRSCAQLAWVSRWRAGRRANVPLPPSPTMSITRR